jgi:bcr-type benzoyl-CoA reductase subunit C
MDKLALFRRIVADPLAYARNWQASHAGKVVGSLCTYTPEEIITAAGALSLRLFPSRSAVQQADVHLQAYCCAHVRGILEDLLAGRLDVLAGAVFPHTCDAIQRFSDIWRINAKRPFHLDVALPVKLNDPAAGIYLEKVLERLRIDLATALDTTITQAALVAAIALHNRIRQALRALYEHRRHHPGCLSFSDLEMVTRAVMMMDRHQAADALQDLLVQVQGSACDPTPAGKRIMLFGGLCSMSEIYKAVEVAGGHIVRADLCSAERYFEGVVDSDGDPLPALARYILQRAVCPSKHAGLFSRGQALLQQVTDYQADGVILVHLKFCDPHAFDYPHLKRLLDEQGIASTLFEIEDQQQGQQQLQTRCEAFLEML